MASDDDDDDDMFPSTPPSSRSDVTTAPTLPPPRKRTRIERFHNDDASLHAMRADGVCRLLKIYVVALAQNVRAAEHLTSASSSVLRDRLFRILTDNSQTLSKLDADATAELYAAATACSEQFVAANAQSERALCAFAEATRTFTSNVRTEAFRLFAASVEPLLRHNAAAAPAASQSALDAFSCTICLDDIAKNAPRCVLRRQCDATECVQCECTLPQMCAQCAVKLLCDQNKYSLPRPKCTGCRRRFCLLDACIVGGGGGDTQ